MTEEELKIAEKLYYFTYPKGDWVGTQARIKKHWIDNARQILSLIKQANYVQLSPGQSLPENPNSHRGRVGVDDYWLGREDGYNYSQQDMLRDKFRRVE